MTWQHWMMTRCASSCSLSSTASPEVRLTWNLSAEGTMSMWCSCPKVRRLSRCRQMVGGCAVADNQARMEFRHTLTRADAGLEPTDPVDARGKVPESWCCVDCGVNTAPGSKTRAEVEA